MTSHALSNYNKVPIQKFGTQASVPTKVTIYKCGEKHDKGQDFLVKHFRTLDQFHKHVAEKCGLMPAVRGLYTVEGKKIASLEEIQHKQILVAVKTGTAFSKDRLPQAIQTAPEQPLAE
jgi:hypothetical protein